MIYQESLFRLEEPDRRKEFVMGVGVTQIEPITAMRAVLEIEDAEVVDSKFTDNKERAQKQFATTLKVISGAGERDGETFSEWFSFLATGEIGPKTKTGQVLTAALGENTQAETLDELATRLIGKTFAAQVGTSKDGQYSRVVHDTINAVPRAVREEESDDADDDSEEDFDSIPF
jgi:hypothetical protein